MFLIREGGFFKEFKVDPDTEVFIIYVIAFRNDATFVKVLLQSPRIYVDSPLLIDIYLGSMAEIFFKEKCRTELGSIDIDDA